MLATAFHALAGNRPHGAPEVDLAPAGTQNFVGSIHAQNAKFERALGDPLALPQNAHESWQLLIGQRLEMLDVGGRPLWEDVLEVAAPPCRIRYVACAPATHGAKVQSCFDALT